MMDRPGRLKLQSIHDVRVQVRSFRGNGKARLPHRVEQVRRLLRHDRVLLTEAERVFLTLLSAFRTQATPAALANLLHTVRACEMPPLHTLGDEAFNTLVVRLEDSGLLQHDLRTETYIPDPAVRAHFLARLAEAAPEVLPAAFTRRYPELAQRLPQLSLPEDWLPALLPHINRSEREAPPAYQVGAYETDLLLLKGLFPGGDLKQTPLESDPYRQGWILNEVGLTLTHLGHLADAVTFGERASETLRAAADWGNASIAGQNLAHLHYLRGRLEQGALAAGEALEAARRAGIPAIERDALACSAWAAHLYGHIEMAGQAFERAQERALGLDAGESAPPGILVGARGLWHAEHLKRMGKTSTARRVTQANLEAWAVAYGRLQDESRCWRMLGDLDALFPAPANSELARQMRAYYDKALWIAQGITGEAALIEALLGRGRWAAQTAYREQSERAPAPNTALSDLTEALQRAQARDYRLCEADIRVGLAWAHLALGDTEAAREEARQARVLSEQMGYYWGKVDAGEVLSLL